MKNTSSAKAVVIAVLAGVIFLGFGGLWLGCWQDPQRQHVRALQRISNHLQREMTALRVFGTPAGHLRGNDRARGELLVAMNTAVWNPLFHWQRCAPEKVTAIADRLDRTKGSELLEVQGCLQLLEEMEAACPTLKDYVWIEGIRRMQDEGVIPRLKR